MAKRKSAENQPDSSAAPFEESLGELQSIVSELEDGSLGLETALARFERGIGLLRVCYAVLESAEAKVEILTRFQGDDPPVTTPFENAATFAPNLERTVSANNGDSGDDDAESSGGRKDDAAKSSLF